jgi:hypothetical protein
MAVRPTAAACRRGDRRASKSLEMKLFGLGRNRVANGPLLVLFCFCHRYNFWESFWAPRCLHAMLRPCTACGKCRNPLFFLDWQPARAAPCTCSFAGVLVSVLALSDCILFLFSYFVYVMLTFSHTCYDSSSSLQHLTYSHISIRYISLLSPSQHHPSRIHFVDSEFEKTIISKFKI